MRGIKPRWRSSRASTENRVRLAWLAHPAKENWTPGYRQVDKVLGTLPMPVIVVVRLVPTTCQAPPISVVYKTYSRAMTTFDRRIEL